MSTKAGLLAFGSTYSPPLPVSLLPKQWYWQISSPITAAGPLPICTGFPIKLSRAPSENRLISKGTIFVNRLPSFLKTNYFCGERFFFDGGIAVASGACPQPSRCCLADIDAMGRKDRSTVVFRC